MIAMWRGLGSPDWRQKLNLQLRRVGYELGEFEEPDDQIEVIPLGRGPRFILQVKYYQEVGWHAKLVPDVDGADAIEYWTLNVARKYPKPCFDVWIDWMVDAVLVATKPQSGPMPDDLVAWLKGERTLSFDATECEIGNFTIHPLNAVHEIELRLSTQGDEWLRQDPHEGQGHYVVQAYDLIASCEGYDPAGLLVYVPSLQAYGSFDCDHESLAIYPGLRWATFLEDPVRYMNAAWGPEPNVAESVNPIGRFPHVGG